MKILQLGKAYPPVNLGGVETTIQLITEGLHFQKIYCDVLGVNDKCKSVLQNTSFGIVYREALLFKFFSTLFSINLIFRLWSIHKKYDIIHIHHPDPMSALALMIINPKCKLVLHWHSDILRQKYLFLIYKPIQNWLLNRVDLIISTSPTYANDSFHLRPYFNKIKVVPIGIDESKLNVDERKVQKILENFEGKKIILAIGRMSYYKGYEYLIDSIDLLGDDFVLLIIGSGDLEIGLKERVSLKSKNKVQFLGRVDDLERNCYLKACNIFVISSIYKTEAFAIVQVEAMAFSKPVVSTIIPGSGVHWVNKNNVSGLTVPLKDSISLANAIDSIIKDKVLYDNLSRGAFLRFKNEFTQQIMTERLLDVYSELV
jgi:glycosyltransferase involved in cell wall biosynthesis